MRPFHILGDIPHDVVLATSGGSDSMVVADFLANGRRKPTLAYFNHGTEHGAEAEAFVTKRATDLGLPLVLGKISREKDKKESWEEYWRIERYKFLRSFDKPVITCHHLDDCVESWIFSSLHGKGKLIPYKNGNIIRPFLLVKKSAILEWAEKKSVKYVDDPSNDDTSYCRNMIRHNIVPNALQINPGLHTTVSKLILANFTEELSVSADRKPV